MAFEKVTKGNTRGDAPAAAIYANGSLRFNKAATDRWLQDVEQIGLYADTETDRLGVSRGESGPDAYALNQTGTGAEATLRTVLTDFGVDYDDIDKPWHFEVRDDPDEGLLVIDISELVAEVA